MAAIPKTIGAYIFIIPLVIAPLYFATNGIFIPKPDVAYGTLILNLLPSGMIGIAIAGLFAAGISTMDSMLNSTSTLFVRDIYERFFVRDKPDSHYFRVARFTTLICLLICIFLVVFVMKVPLIITMEKTLMAIFEGPLVALLALGIFWKRANGKGALIGLGCGGVATLSMHLFAHLQFLEIEAIGGLISIVAVVLGSILTEAPRVEQIEGLTWGVGYEKRISKKISERVKHAKPLPPISVKVPFYKDMRLWATIFLLIQILLLLYYAGV
jgi:Na+/proline symporter